jgi:long-chain acyl-CoA synthetase
MTNLASLLLDHPFAPDQPLIHGSLVDWTKADAIERVMVWADDFRAGGVLPGQAIAVVRSHAPDVIIAMAAIWSISGVFVPVNPLLPQAAIDEIIEAIRPAAVLHDSGISARPDALTYADGVAFVQWTSGTTGRPKPVLHTHDAYLELLDRVLAPLRASASSSNAPVQPSKAPSPNLIPVSISLNAGIYNVLFGLRAGAPIVVMDRFTTRESPRW